MCIRDRLAGAEFNVVESPVNCVVPTFNVPTFSCDIKIPVPYPLYLYKSSYECVSY